MNLPMRTERMIEFLAGIVRKRSEGRGVDCIGSHFILLGSCEFLSWNGLTVLGEGDFHAVRKMMRDTPRTNPAWVHNFQSDQSLELFLSNSCYAYEESWSWM